MPFLLVTWQSQTEQGDHLLHVDKQLASSAVIQEWGKQDGQTGYGNSRRAGHSSLHRQFMQGRRVEGSSMRCSSHPRKALCYYQHGAGINRNAGGGTHKAAQTCNSGSSGIWNPPMGPHQVRVTWVQMSPNG